MTETHNQPVGVCNPKPMAERVEFEIVAQCGRGEFRVWTDGEYVMWSEKTTSGMPEHRSEGMIPRPLFILAAKGLAERCESEAHGDNWDSDSKLLHAAGENMVQPIVLPGMEKMNT